MSDNISSNNSWSEYGRLVLKELERLNEGQNRIREDMDNKFSSLNLEISKYKKIDDEVKAIKEWQEKISEVWSPTQMSESKNEIYKQKNKWQKVIGFVIALQFLIYVAFNFFKK